ncbi:hypothetical protein GCM10020001_092990 [Nonomuraea salmonea]
MTGAGEVARSSAGSLLASLPVGDLAPSTTADGVSGMAVHFLSGGSGGGRGARKRGGGQDQAQAGGDGDQPA